MSFTKRLLFGNDPAMDGERAKLRAEFDTYRRQFPHRIAGRRRAPKGHPRYWHPLWPACLSVSARELGIDTLNINSGVFVRTTEDRDRLIAAAEAMFKAKGG